MTVRCAEPIGTLGMVTIDDGIGGAIAARVVAQVTVMRRKSYDPPWTFTNPFSSQYEAEGESRGLSRLQAASAAKFDRKAGCLQMSADLPTMKDVQAEPELEPEPEPEPESEAEAGAQLSDLDGKRNAREEMKKQAEDERAAADAAAEAMAVERGEKATMAAAP